MPTTWSDWVALIGAMVGTVTGVLGLVLSYIAVRRDRSDIDVTLTIERYGWKEMLEHEYPGVRFGPHRSADNAQEWFVFSAVNIGLRPVHIEKAVVIWVERHGPGSNSWSGPYDIVLSEERRRASLAFTSKYHAAYDLWCAQFVDDTGREYTAHGAAYSSWLRRRRWERQRAKALEADTHELQPPASN
jgi:hypothetical protein